MRRVLIIAYYWPPSGGGGVQRWLKFTRYLPEFGWHPIVYVPYNPQYPLRDETLIEKVPDHIEVIRGHIWEARRIYRRLKKLRHGKRWSAPTEMDTLFWRDPKALSWFGRLALFLRSNLFVPDSRSLWIKPSIRRLTTWLKENPVDVIVSTGPPHSCHLIGMGLARNTGIPWVADFRDPWTDIDYFHKLLLTNRNRRRHEQMQRDVLTKADKVITVSPSWARLFEDYGAGGVEVITNGFDPGDILISAPGKREDGKIRIASIGTLEADRHPVALWQAMDLIISQHPEARDTLEFHFAGKVDPEILPSNPEVRKLVTLHGYVSHKEAISMMQDADVLLLILNKISDRNSMGRIPGKLFEYIATGKPIIAIGTPGSDSANIVGTVGQNWVLSHEDMLSTQRCILEILDGVSLASTGREISQYERRSLTSRLAEVLSQVSA